MLKIREKKFNQGFIQDLNLKADMKLTNLEKVDQIGKESCKHWK